MNKKPLTPNQRRRKTRKPPGMVVTNPTAYVRTLRRKSRGMTDEEFLADLKKWEKS